MQRPFSDKNVIDKQRTEDAIHPQDPKKKKKKLHNAKESETILLSMT